MQKSWELFLILLSFAENENNIMKKTIEMNMKWKYF